MSTRSGKRDPLQALGGVQTVVLGTVYLLVALAALAVIGIYSALAARESASALQLEKSVAQLHIVLRGLNEMVVTQGSTASQAVVNDASARFGQLRSQPPRRTPGCSRSGPKSTRGSPG